MADLESATGFDDERDNSSSLIQSDMENFSTFGE